MFVSPNYTFAFTSPYFWRGVARMLGIRRRHQPVVFRTPPSAR